MSLAEVTSRLSEVGSHVLLSARLSRVHRQAYGSLPSPDHSSMVHGLEHGVDATAADLRQRVLTYSEEWFQHRARFFALQGCPLGEAIAWHCDYSTGTVGPMKYSGFINFRDIKIIGNVKYIWELNRLQHLILFALAARWTGREDYRDEIARQIVSWCMQNPFMKGVNWTSPLEAGIRLISLAITALLLGGAEAFDPALQRHLLRTIYYHQYFIRAFYSKHSSANNHLIGEMTGLYVGSVIWPLYRESAKWRAFARAKLCEEILRQTELDGVHKERATEYQLFVVEFFLLAGALGHAIDDPFPPEYWERLTRMISVLPWLSDRSGNLPTFGDGDGGQVVWLPEMLHERARSLWQGFAAGNVQQDVDLRTCILLWGQRLHQVPVGQLPNPDSGLQCYPHGGYYVLAARRGCENEMVVVFDAGPHGLAPLYAHGHADALSFWLSYGGYEFLIDPGTYCYDFHPQWRSYFRGTRGHNTIRIDGEDQSIAGGTFLWQHVARCHLEKSESTAEFVAVIGLHDGYCRLSDPVVHRRSLCLYKRTGILTIADWIECQASHEVEILFHLSETCRIQRVGPASFQVSNSHKRISLRFHDAGLAFDLYRGSESPMLGWISSSFDVKRPTFTLAARTQIQGTRRFLTEIVGL
jgi:uncharacterized heparinase superfamily protein